MEELQTNWWALTIRGLAAVVFGALTMLVPGLTLAALVLLFAGYCLVDGIFSIVGAIKGMTGERRWVLLFQGIISVAAAVVAVIWPASAALALVFLIASWALITGLLHIVTAVRLRKVIKGEWLLALSGAASVALGVVLMLNPGPGALAMVLWIGAYALVSGVLLVALSMRLRFRAREHLFPTFVDSGPIVTP